MARAPAQRVRCQAWSCATSVSVIVEQALCHDAEYMVPRELVAGFRL